MLCEEVPQSVSKWLSVSKNIRLSNNLTYKVYTFY